MTAGRTTPSPFSLGWDPMRIFRHIGRRPAIKFHANNWSAITTYHATTSLPSRKYRGSLPHQKRELPLDVILRHGIRAL